MCRPGAAMVSWAIGRSTGPFHIIGGGYPQQTVAAARGQPPHLPSFGFLEPVVQGVGAQVAPHHQRRARAGGEPGEPPARAARAGPACRSAPAGWTRSRRSWPAGQASRAAPRGRWPARRGPRWRRTAPGRARSRRSPRPSRRGRGPPSRRRSGRNRSRGRAGRRPRAGPAGLEQEPGPRVEAAGGEHPGIGLELQVQVGQHDPDQPGPVRGRRLRGEVVLRLQPRLRQRPTGCWGALAVSAASAGVMKLRFTHRSTTNVITGMVPASIMMTVCLRVTPSFCASM